MRIRKNKKARIIAVLSILLFLINVGYAFLQTDLSTTGTAVIKNQTWNVRFSNVQTTSGSVTPATAPAINATANQLTWAVNMTNPGDFYEFTVDVTNSGTVDVMIADVLNTTLTTEQAKYLTYTVTYEDYKPIEQYDKLTVSETDSLRIRLEVKSDADPQDILNSSQSFSLDLKEIYAVADNNALARTKAVKYTVAFDKNHADATGTMANQVFIHDRAANINANGFERTGYHLTNWNTEADGSGTSYTDGQSVTNIGNVTLYAQWAINTYTIAFDKNASDATGTMSDIPMTYGTASNLTANGFSRTRYTFENWNTKADGTGTTYTDSQSVNNLTQENGATVTLYAQWEGLVTKYAVQIYGINQDVAADGTTKLGLTFGPAVGADYNNAYVTHKYEKIPDDPENKYYVKIVTHTVPATGSETTSEEYLYKNGGSTEKVTRTQAQVTARKNISLHDMTWTQIKNVSDKTLFEDCMLCGDTKSVKLSLNSTIASETQQTARGDGTGILHSTIKSDYHKWNYTNNNDREDLAYAGSRIRATLIGSIENVTKTTYAGSDVLDSTTCLYSCIESDLRNVITAKQVKYVTGTSTSSYDSNTLVDKIWLFSDREMYGTGECNGYTTEGLDNSRVTNDTGVGYDKFANTESKYYISSYNESSNTNKVAYYEDGSTNFWWLRSPDVDSTNCVRNVRDDGSISYHRAYYDYGVAFGFCI